MNPRTVLLGLAVGLTGCEAFVTHDCSCTTEYEDYAYYFEGTFVTSVCESDPEAANRDATGECVADIQSANGNYYGISCTCTCQETSESC